MIPTERFFEMALAMKDEVIARWPPDAAPLPERAFVHTGVAAIDEPQFVVAVQRVFGTLGDVGFEQFTARQVDVWYLRAIGIELTIDRYCGTFDVHGETEVRTPEIAQMESEAKERLADAAALTRCVIEAVAADAFGVKQGVAFEGWSARGPDGGMAGGTLGVRLGLF